MALKKLWKLLGHGEWDLWWNFGFGPLRFLALFHGMVWLEPGQDTNWRAAWRLFSVALAGFAGADACASLLKQFAAGLGSWPYLLGVLVVALMLLGLCTLHARCSAEDLELRLRDEQLQASGFVVGFLASTWARFAVTGFLPGSKGRALTVVDTHGLSAAAGAAVLLYLAALRLSGQLMGGRYLLLCWVDFSIDSTMLLLAFVFMACGEPKVELSVVCGRYLDGLWKGLLEMLAMVASWLVFYSLQWGIWEAMTEHHRRMSPAERCSAFALQALCSLVAAVGVFVGCPEPELVRAVAVHVGFSWEAKGSSTMGSTRISIIESFER